MISPRLYSKLDAGKAFLLSCAYASSHALNVVDYPGMIGWVDRGGISLKPSADMDKMRADMGGAACVVGAILAASRLKLPLNIKGIHVAHVFDIIQFSLCHFDSEHVL